VSAFFTTKGFKINEYFYLSVIYKVITLALFLHTILVRQLKTGDSTITQGLVSK